MEEVANKRLLIRKVLVTGTAVHNNIQSGCDELSPSGEMRFEDDKLSTKYFEYNLISLERKIHHCNVSGYQESTLMNENVANGCFVNLLSLYTWGHVRTELF